MNPFADLVRVATKRRGSRAVCASMPTGGIESTSTGVLLHLLDCNGPMTTRELGDEVAMPTKLVWGLLKGPQQRGQVRFNHPLWEIDSEFPGCDVLRAAELLRVKGWTVAPPALGPNGARNR